MTNAHKSKGDLNWLLQVMKMPFTHFNVCMFNCWRGWLFLIRFYVNVTDCTRHDQSSLRWVAPRATLSVWISCWPRTTSKYLPSLLLFRTSDVCLDAAICATEKSSDYNINMSSFYGVSALSIFCNLYQNFLHLCFSPFVFIVWTTQCVKPHNPEHTWT